MDDQVPIEEPEEFEQPEIKRELSDENNQTVDDEDDPNLDDDCITSSDGIFELIPFMAKLLSNLKCTFYSRNTEIVIASIELMSVQELVDRLLTNRIQPIRMHCGNDATFTISIFEDQFTKSISSNNAIANGSGMGNFSPAANNSNIFRFLPNMAVVTECSNLTLLIENGEIVIRSISYDSLAGLMARLKQYDIRPKQVDSLKDCAFSVVFNEPSFANCASVERLFPPREVHPPIGGGPGSTNASEGLLAGVRRPRICPNYLRDYVVENKFEASPSGLDLLPPASAAASVACSFLSRHSSSLFGSSMGALAAFRGLCESSTSERSRDANGDSPTLVKRGRGRPRIRPKPNGDNGEPNGGSGDPNAPKKPRGRPRRSDVVPNILGTRPNSFINIQPKAMSRQELEQCFAKLLENDMVGVLASNGGGLSK